MPDTTAIVLGVCGGGSRQDAPVGFLRTMGKLLEDPTGTCMTSKVFDAWLSQYMLSGRSRKSSARAATNIPLCFVRLLYLGLDLDMAGSIHTQLWFAPAAALPTYQYVW